MNKNHVSAFLKKVDKRDLKVLTICPFASVPELVEFLKIKYPETSSTDYIFKAIQKDQKTHAQVKEKIILCLDEK